jgi:hypothetical protein
MMQLDNAKPVRTYAPDGTLISTTSETPTKVMDRNGRPIAESTTTPAATNPASSTDKADAITETKETKEEAKENRKTFLQAQKAARRAAELEKKAEQKAGKADAIEAALTKVSSGEDPTAILEAFGIDKIKFYKDLTAYALKPENKPEDPRDKKIRELEERQTQYAKEREIEVKTYKDQQEMAAHNQAIQSNVIPLITNNAEKYECLLANYGKDAAIQVYQTTLDLYYKDEKNEDGSPYTFEQVADQMEKYWAEFIEAGLNSASKMKRFANRFGQSPNSKQQINQSSQTETPKRSQTLTNKQSGSPQSQTHSSNRLTMTRDEYVNSIIRKYESK